MRASLRFVVAVLVVAACGAPRARVEKRESVREVLMEDAVYRAVSGDGVLQEEFGRYWGWLGGLGIPDVEYLGSLPPDDLEHLAMSFHEQVELAGWLRLGHAFDDVMTLDYYQQHYEAVYPVAHAEAMTAELALLAGYAERVGLPRVRGRAFVVTSPMIERRGVTAAMADRRLKFNPAIAAEVPTRDELEAAVRTYEAGGYRYRDRERVIADGLAVVGAH